MSGIYIHIPFCKQACHYCDFHFSTSLKYKEAMLLAIQDELKLRAISWQGEQIDSIYFGGGTPSLLTSVELQKLLEVIQKYYPVSKFPEISLEANPDDLTAEKIVALSKTPINRLSIGIQSFFDEDLKMMNRAHLASDSENCLSVASRYFDNISIDLIYGLPSMTISRWKQNLQKAFDFNPGHISSYALTVEKKTALDRFIKNKTYPPLDDALAFKHFEVLVLEAEKQGFIHYEISNFGKPNYFSKHNTSYWKGINYIGVGPSAHSFNGTHRSWNVANNAFYVKALKNKQLPLELEELSVSDRYNEYVMMGLRTIYGVSMNRVQLDFPSKYSDHLNKEIQPFLKDNRLELCEGLLKTTKKGKFFVDGIASELFYVED